MKILLLGEYSNVHWTLSQGLRALGHEVTVVSNGDGWKNYPRDIDLRRRSLGHIDTLRYLFDLKRIAPALLVDASEAADTLGCTRQNLHALAKLRHARYDR